jgi:hypothetical protein
MDAESESTAPTMAVVDPNFRAMLTEYYILHPEEARADAVDMMEKMQDIPADALHEEAEPLPDYRKLTNGALLSIIVYASAELSRRCHGSPVSPFSTSTG